MKNILFLILIILLTSPFAWAGGLTLGPGTTVIGGGVPAAGCADTSCAGFLICQNFEGTGYDNSEYWEVTGGTVNPDYTTIILRGSQSLGVYAGETTYGLVHVHPSASGEIYGHFLFQTPDTPGTAAIIFSTTGNVAIKLTTDLKLNIKEDSTPYRTATTTNALSTGTTYHIWFYLKKVATSGDGKGSVEFTASNVYSPVGSGNAFAGWTNGGAAADFDSLTLRARYGAGDWLFDQFLVSATAITNVCP